MKGVFYLILFFKGFRPGRILRKLQGRGSPEGARRQFSKIPIDQTPIPPTKKGRLQAKFQFLYFGIGVGRGLIGLLEKNFPKSSSLNKMENYFPNRQIGGSQLQYQNTGFFRPFNGSILL